MTDEPKLLGDVTEEMLRKIGAEKLAKAYERLTGKPCNCGGRKTALNNIHRMVIGRPPERPDRAIPQVARPQPTAPVEELPPKTR